MTEDKSSPIGDRAQIIADEALDDVVGGASSTVPTVKPLAKPAAVNKPAGFMDYTDDACMDR